MFDDILGKKSMGDEETSESIIEAMKDNIEVKEKIIEDLCKQITELEEKVTELERQLETKDQTCAGI